MIFSQHKETCEVLLDNSKIGVDNIKEFLANIDVHRRILIADFPGDGLKFIEKLKSHCANMTFAEK